MTGDNLTPGLLKRGLKNRHIQLISLGGAIGTGLFLGSAGVLKSAGPSMILGYAIGGFIAFLIMRQLGEMIVEEPVAGSFSHFAHKYWGGFAGFLSGWNYWVLYVLVGMAELTAVGKYVQFWWPEVPTWVSRRGVLRAGQPDQPDQRQSVRRDRVLVRDHQGGGDHRHDRARRLPADQRYWRPAGIGQQLVEPRRLLPERGQRFADVIAFIMFSFGGLELVGITAAEADEPRKVIPKAINQVIYRILIFYIGALAVLLSLYPWDQLLQTLDASGDAYSGSPFVQIFSLIGNDAAAQILNVVVLTAALSVYNSGVYCNSRMLYGLAEQGDAPNALMKLNRHGVPYLAIGVSALVTLLCVVVNYVAPHEALELLMALVVASLIINWAVISLTHLKFRKAMNQQGVVPGFKAFWTPFSQLSCLAFVALILGVMLMIPGISVSVYIMPVWVLFILGLYRLRVGKQVAKTA